MYSGQFLEMMSQSVHAQNLAGAERHRFTGAAADEPATHRASSMPLLLGQLGRLARFGAARPMAVRERPVAQ
jgi:hypothetical protein